MELSMQCEQCGASVAREAAYCQQCGHRVHEGNGQRGGATQPNRLTGDQKAGHTAGSQYSAIEEDLWQGGYSGKTLVGQWILAGLISIACLASLVIWPAYWLYLLGAIAAIWILAGLRYALHRLDVRYRLTTHRFYHQHGILRRTTERIEVIDMDDITYTQGPIERLLGVGTIKITSSDSTHPELYLYGIDGVQTIAQHMDDARRAERARRGIYIESV